MKRQVFIAGVWHETNSFSSVPTDIAALRAYHLVEGDAMLADFAGTNTEIGGMLSVSGALGLEAIPGLFAGALPGAPMVWALFEGIVAGVCARARLAPVVDGALLALHGAMVVEDCDEADAYLVERLREALGPGVPIVATFDLHANLSPRLVEAADLLVGYRTNPHVDMAERGAEAATALARLLDGARRPRAALTRVPLASVSQVQVTSQPPMSELMAEVDAVREHPGVLACSVAVGYPYADVAHLGLSVLVYADEYDVARAGAERIARAAWHRRRQFVPAVVPVREAVARALEAHDTVGPVVLVDVADNIGGGTPGDGTAILAALLAARAPSAVVVLADAEAARAACALGTNGVFRGLVGGKCDDRHGPPTLVEGIVRFADRVEYRRDERWMAGQIARLGQVAVVQCGGVSVVLTETRVLPYDTRHLRVLGIEPERQRVLVVKAAAGWRTPFESMMTSCIYVDAPGSHAPDLQRFPYTRRPRPLYPLDGEFEWDAADVSEVGARSGASDGIPVHGPDRPSGIRSAG